jgi:hypothetical protein
LYLARAGSAILVERARQTYSFLHLTFQEYLTAKFIVDNGSVEKLIKYHLTNKKWREVFLLISGLLPGRKGADDLLLGMEKQAMRRLSSPIIIKLVRWAQKNIEVDNLEIKPVSRRLSSIFLVLSLAFSRDLNRGFNLERIKELACKLSNGFETHDKSYVLANDLDSVYTLTRDLTLDIDLDLALGIAYDLANEYLEIDIFKRNLIIQIINDIDLLVQEFDEYKRSFKKTTTAYSKFGNRVSFIGSIPWLFLDNLGLESDSIFMSYEESRRLEGYFYILELMLSCKEAAVRVSPQVWQGIESRMLTVPKEDGV